ncbi:MAG: ABC transporter ATP-binding protein [Anaerolineaceae bacterium]|nr:ABC transporter ATP-binding protein [Anaerolineaceae bacterium]
MSSFSPAEAIPKETQEHQAEAVPLISLRNVVKCYKTNSGDFKALNGINADFYAGEFVGIVGRSGAGKSTLVNMITGVDHLSSGEVWVNNHPVHKMNENQVALWRGRNLGIVYQSFRLMPSLCLLDNIMLPMDFCGLYDRKKSPQRAMALLEEVELADHAFKPPSAISGGQQQRVAIARALANDPPILVADEPTGRLDSLTAEIIVRMFEKLASQGKLVIMVTHDTGVLRRATRSIIIQDGEIVQDSQQADL